MGFTTSEAAHRELEHARSLLALTEGEPRAACALADKLLALTRTGQALPPVEETRRRLGLGVALGALPTVAEYLTDWISRRRKIKKNTVKSYGAHIRVHLIPHLGHYRLDQLRADHIMEMFDAIDEENAYIQGIRDHGSPQEKAAIRGRRTTGPATMQRIRATLRKALNDAIWIFKFLVVNVACHLEMPDVKKQRRMAWTDEAVQAWERTGIMPAKMMEWTPQQTGRFLDAAVHDPLYGIFRLMAYRAVRRGEGCGLRWPDVAFERKIATIAQQIVQLGWETVIDTPKSRAGNREIALDEDTVAVLRHRKRIQERDRLAAGEAWVDTNLVFTHTDGTQWHPQQVTQRFHQIRRQAGLPPIRLYDLRHGAATYSRAAHVDPQQIQSLFGHATAAFTQDNYGASLIEDDFEAATKTAQIIPHRWPPEISAT